jgi:iron(III) transport system ATP-binding protein
MVFQDYALFPHLSVRDNVRFGLVRPWRQRLRGMLLSAGGARAAGEGRGAWARRRELAALLRLTGLSELADRYPHEVSGGQQQRVALARALAPRPHLILLDEPFSSQDTALRQRIREDVRSVLHASATASILVTHDQEEAINVADRLAIMNNGRLEQVGTPEALLACPRTRFVAEFLGLSRFVPGQVHEGRVRTELGDFPLPPKGAPAPIVDVLVRPAQIVLGENAGPLAQVLAVEYLGGHPLYTLALPSGRRVLALLAQQRPLHVGERVAVRFRPQPLVMFPAQTQ